MAIPNWETENNGGEATPEPSSIEKFKTSRPPGYDIRKDAVMASTIKAWLVLVDSDKEDWGLIEDTHGNFNWVPGKGEVVGTWSRTQFDGLIHLGVETSIAALQDRSIQIWSKYAEERRVQKATGKKPRKAKALSPEEAALPSPGLSLEQKMEFNSLRAKLLRSKSGGK